MNSKRGLGRGLDALLSGGRDSERGEHLTQVPVGDISPNPFQPRREFDEARLQDLAESIKMYGVLQPVVVRVHGAGYQLVTGERRWRASQMAGLTDVPAVIREYSDTEMTAVALVENLQRENLNPIEEAIAFRKLIDEFGFTQEEVSEKVGRSRPFIANAVRLLNLPAQVQEYVSRGTMTPGQARPLLVLPTAALQIEAATEILSQALTARGAEELAKKWNAKKNHQSKKRAISMENKNVRQDVVEELSRRLGTRVEIEDRNDGGGTIIIEFYSSEELDRLVEFLTDVGVAGCDNRKKNKNSRFSV